ncbi:dead end protein homolog 1 [Melospiza georgiana]|uniref:dead end protein homolog 1 n=1 Tax=Melospiza georgiana TaxID=44398 RepID=UPI0025ACA2A9|nr:dead end protein homolog 1 [Melospiza georgiana]
MDEKIWKNKINEANKMALLAWEKETGIELVQINGQRRYGGPPPGWVGGPPPAGTEVYIARLPQDIYEDTLLPLFGSVGRLYEFRLMMTFSGMNRGFAYARYASRQDARSAIATFHRFQLRRGCAIVVCWSTQKRELLVSGLGASVSRRELEATLQRVTEGICSVTVHASPSQKQAKLAVLKYRSHQAAALAKKTLMEGTLRLGKAKMMVEWLNPQLKQKLQLCEEEPPSSWVQGGESPAVPPPLSLQNVLHCLNTLCWKHHLRTPLIRTKCVQVNPNGWQHFWYQVAIPGSHVPVSGFMWISPDRQGQSEHEKAKVVAALHLLRVLAESLGPVTDRSQSLWRQPCAPTPKGLLCSRTLSRPSPACPPILGHLPRGPLPP